MTGKGSQYEDEEGVKRADKWMERTKWILSCVGSALVSAMGGLILGWWAWERSRHHGQGHEMWMVPVGLILLITPILAFFSLILSQLLNTRGG
ncbi:hypothetical protein SAY87_010978 [Trapa incisa]|uniref:Uncharacterized protein n=1 Tax=Trapa incisa TaxID=236973 RepID=A0AAN7JB73_9MYRT|nr:hypothetical protein SAY87_010978 [Trapa incisa]